MARAPRKPRDYKAEEARRNARAKSAGFTTRAAERSARVKAKAWSDKHSRGPGSAYLAKMSAQQLRNYMDAYVTDWDDKRNRSKTDVRKRLAAINEYRKWRGLSPIYTQKDGSY